MKVAISQSNYIPWKGYFDMINSVDIFVIYDDAQYTRRDWRNRNKIKTPSGPKWITIPVKVKGTYGKTKINEITVQDNNWRQKHWKTIVHNYSKSKYFKKYKSLFEDLYLKDGFPIFLSEINKIFIETINKILGIKTEILTSSSFKIYGNKSEKLLNICMDLKADTYVSGPAAKDYLDINLFNSHDIKVEWMDYSGYPEYPQLFPPFIHEVSIIDLIFNTGNEAKNYMKSFKKI